MPPTKANADNFFSIEENLWKVARIISSEKWVAIGRSLNLKEKIIDEIRSKFGMHDTDECTIQMLKAWRETFPERTPQDLITALNDVGMNSRAIDVQKIISDFVDNKADGENAGKKNPISALRELCQNKKWEQPEFRVEQTEQSKFLCKVVMKVEFSAKSPNTCNSRKEAEKQAALEALKSVYELVGFPESLSPSDIEGFQNS